MRGGVWEGGVNRPRQIPTSLAHSHPPSEENEWTGIGSFVRSSVFFPLPSWGDPPSTSRPFPFSPLLPPHPSSFLVVPSISSSSSSSFTAIPSSTLPLPPLLFYFLFTVTPSNNSTINSASESRHSFPGILVYVPSSLVEVETFILREPTILFTHPIS
ncbi:hypothetical protein CGRA01v4_03820 [Colletotrichum graminicola]|nr:hypothetical protein CGRA01v4_03820 [Colletotrichum graminicola]